MSAGPVVTAACFFCCRRAMGEASARHSLRPLPDEGDLSSITRALDALRASECMSVSKTQRLRPNLRSSSPAKAGDPVRRGSSAQALTSLEYWIARTSV
jgi:hypothetical protein